MTACTLPNAITNILVQLKSQLFCLVHLGNADQEMADSLLEGNEEQ